MTTLERASAEITLLHEQIEAWFRGNGTQDALEALIDCFADAFQMVTIRGELMSRDDTRSLFARLHGARPGITLAIDQVAVVVDTADGWLVTYRETQVLADGSMNRRHSGAWLRPAGEGRPKWRYLQETTVP